MTFEHLKTAPDFALEALDDLNPDTVYHVKGEKDKDGNLFSGYKLKSDDSWHIFKREVVYASGDIAESMMLRGEKHGFGRIFYVDGRMHTFLMKNDDKWGEETVYKADGSVETVTDNG